MAGDIIGQPTVLTGLLVTSTPGSALTNMPAPVAGGPALATYGSGVTVSVLTGARVAMDVGSTITVTGETYLSSLTVQANSQFLGRITLTSTSSLHVLSGSTVHLGAAHVSMRTVNAASLASVGPTDLNSGVFGFQLAASGMSLLYRSGNTIYFFNSAASVAASGA